MYHKPYLDAASMELIQAYFTTTLVCNAYLLTCFKSNTTDKYALEILVDADYIQSTSRMLLLIKYDLQVLLDRKIVVLNACNFSNYHKLLASGELTLIFSNKPDYSAERQAS